MLISSSESEEKIIPQAPFHRKVVETRPRERDRLCDAPGVVSSYQEALERIGELEEEFEALDALLLMRERATTESGDRHDLAEVARDLGAEDLLGR